MDYSDKSMHMQDCQNYDGYLIVFWLQYIANQGLQGYN